MLLGRSVTIMAEAEISGQLLTQRRTVLFRTAQGTKLYSAVMGDSELSRPTTTILPSPTGGA